MHHIHMMWLEHPPPPHSRPDQTVRFISAAAGYTSPSPSVVLPFELASMNTVREHTSPTKPSPSCQTRISEATHNGILASQPCKFQGKVYIPPPNRLHIAPAFLKTKKKVSPPHQSSSQNRGNLQHYSSPPCHDRNTPTPHNGIRPPAAPSASPSHAQSQQAYNAP